MEARQLQRPPREARQYSWSVVLPRPRARNVPLRPETLNASEQMFFFGAPLAHVVRYEEHLKATRQERTFKHLARSRRVFNFAVQLDVLHQLPSPLPELANEG